jgi:hypothetical protein
MSNQHDAHEFLTKLTSRHQIPITHQKIATLIATASCPDRKSKQNFTFINKDGSEIEQEWIKEFKDWLLLSGLIIAGKVIVSRWSSLMSAKTVH